MFFPTHNMMYRPIFDQETRCVIKSENKLQLHHHYCFNESTGKFKTQNQLKFTEKLHKKFSIFQEPTAFHTNIILYQHKKSLL